MHYIFYISPLYVVGFFLGHKSFLPNLRYQFYTTTYDGSINPSAPPYFNILNRTPLNPPLLWLPTLCSTSLFHLPLLFHWVPFALFFVYGCHCLSRLDQWLRWIKFLFVAAPLLWQSYVLLFSKLDGLLLFGTYCFSSAKNPLVLLNKEPIGTLQRLPFLRLKPFPHLYFFWPIFAWIGGKVFLEEEMVGNKGCIWFGYIVLCFTL